MFKKKQETEKQEQELTIKEKMKVQDFMPNYAKQEACFKDAIITDTDTKRKTDQTWPRLKNGNEIGYDNWLDKVINPETGEWFPKRDKEGKVTERDIIG